ncbi:hypothetical protein Q7P37_000419 [Cladosporium fusiforme]
MSQEFTFSDVSEHTTKKDLYMVIHDKVYNCTSFVDEHPGGEEVLLDVGGQDSTEAFEDVGHSDEAREILEGLLVGTLKRGVSRHSLSLSSRHSKRTHCPRPHARRTPNKPAPPALPPKLTHRQANDPPAKTAAPTTSQTGSGSGSQANMGVGLYALILIGGALAFFIFQYLQKA